ncbi:flagellar basal body P-ring biosynthesis protein FlgA [Kushneria pakistanensis]|uniref:Flagella basal body P-ring formation protein FlgA n=1 Tax=Kushneria pakistanensis TaxID=1508770 RepID=A0ABQ3FQ05_9GAMM|nr:flagellar basal body P-ring formation chaperone FlgA [Kushneria pakistanensis]GHC33549.1 flagellar basal body P-ring biosynthesis protein FlgA [Kushneria pakistanensis]
MSLPFTMRSHYSRYRRLAGLVLVATGFTCASVQAGEQVIYDVIEGFLLEQTASESGDITIDITPSPAAAMACRAPSPFLPGRGGKISGRTSVGVRCPGDAPETRYFQAYVHINGPYPVVNRDIAPGDVIGENDLDWQEGDLTRLSSRLITDASQLVGQVAQRRIAAGQPFQAGMVKAPVVIQRGAKVALLIKGNGFMISSSGQALNDAGLGESVRVKMPSGSIINGEASRDGLVEVN